MVIDPMGQPMAMGRSFADKVIESTVDIETLHTIRRNLPFFTDGDDFSIR